MAVVVAQDGLVAVAQPQRGGAFPLVAEAAGLGELVAGAGLRDEVHGAAGADRGELAVVADEQQLGAGGLGAGVDGGQRGGVGHRGLVDHDEVAGAQGPRGVGGVGLVGLRRGGPGSRASGRRCGR